MRMKNERKLEDFVDREQARTQIERERIEEDKIIEHEKRVHGETDARGRKRRKGALWKRREERLKSLERESGASERRGINGGARDRRGKK